MTKRNCEEKDIYAERVELFQPMVTYNLYRTFNVRNDFDYKSLKYE